jgi:acyl-CoA thioester hydrolase
MKPYSRPVEIRWSDIDANFHLRHSVYYDLCASVRVDFLNQYGVTVKHMQEHHIGPILFREECVFKREIHYQDQVEIRVEMISARQDMSRWSMRHEIWKNGDTLCSILTIDGAWMDTRIRKLAAPPELFRKAFENIPRSEQFSWQDA